MAETMEPRYKRHFDSIESLMAHCLNDKPVDSRVDVKKCSSETGQSSFTGTKSFSEACELLSNGWPQGRERAAKILKSIAVRHTNFSQGKAVQMDIGGAYPIAAMAAAGQMECMVNFAPVEDRARPIVRLMVALGGNQTYSSDSISNYGLGLMAYIEALEAADFRVEINVGWFNQFNGTQQAFTATIKKAEDPLDVDRVVFCIGNTSFVRRIMFRVMELNCTRDWLGTYARPRTGRASDGDFDSEVIYLQGAQTFGASSYQLKSPEAALKAMRPIITDALVNALHIPPPLQMNETSN
jgi:hypothetical protein